MTVDREGREDLTEEQQRKLQMQEQIEMLSGEVDDMDQQIAYLLDDQKEIQQNTNVLKQVASQKQHELQ